MCTVIQPRGVRDPRSGGFGSAVRETNQSSALAAMGCTALLAVYEI